MTKLELGEGLGWVTLEIGVVVEFEESKLARLERERLQPVSKKKKKSS